MKGKNDISTIKNIYDWVWQNVEYELDVLVSPYCYTFVKAGFDIILQLFFISLPIISKHKIKLIKYIHHFPFQHPPFYMLDALVCKE